MTRIEGGRAGRADGARVRFFRVMGIACALLSVAWGSACLAGSGTVPSAPTNVMVDGQPSAPLKVVSGAPSGEFSGMAVSGLAQTFSGVTEVPTLPAASGTGDIVAFAVQNAGPQATAARYITFGQVFLDGAVQPQESVVAQEPGGVAVPVQIDPLALWPDGSVRFAAVSLEVPALKPAMKVDYILASSGSKDGAPLSLSAAPFTLTITLNFSGSLQSTKTIDLHAALLQALTSNPSLWLSGPLAVQARVDVPVTNTLHLTADITEYKGGQITADIQLTLLRLRPSPVIRFNVLEILLRPRPSFPDPRGLNHRPH